MKKLIQLSLMAIVVLMNACTTEEKKAAASTTIKQLTFTGSFFPMTSYFGRTTRLSLESSVVWPT